MFPSELMQIGVKIEDFYSPGAGIDKDYAKARRRDYLQCRAISIRAEIDAEKIIYQQLFEEDSSYDDRYTTQVIIEAWQKELRKIETELYFLDSANSGEAKEFQARLFQAKNRKFSEFLQLRKGRSVCPFHGGDNPTAFSVRNERGHCFVCDWNGDIIDFVKEKYGLTFMETVEKLT